MAKTETIHARIDPKTKLEADKIFKSIGLNISQAIKLFLIAAINHKGMPFELTNSNEKSENDLKFATAIATVDGVAPSKEAEEIMRLFSKKIIDYETAQEAIKKIYK